MSIKADVKDCTKSFWKYASQIKGTADIENVFIDWAARNSQELSLNNIQEIWDSINQDIFDIRTAFNADAFKMILDNVLEGTATPEEEQIVEDISKDSGSTIPDMLKLDKPTNSTNNDVKSLNPTNSTSTDAKPTDSMNSSIPLSTQGTEVDPGESKKDLTLPESLLL